MPENHMKIYRKIFEDAKKRDQDYNERRKQEAMKRRAEGKSLPGDYVYFQEPKNDTIAHQDEKIAHPDTMGKTASLMWLIIGMVGSLIFNQWYLIWVILLLWYFSKSRV